MKVGIVGLPNVGKSTLFNALTKSYAADAANFPFCTIDPNVWVVDVKDPRVDVLAELWTSKKKVYAHITFVDIAWLVKGASKWEWMGNAFLSHIREVDAIVQVLRHFKDTDVVHVEGDVNPLRDVEIINTELILSDLEQLDKKIPQLQKKAKGKDLESIKALPLLEKIRGFLVEWRPAIDVKEDLSPEEIKIIKGYHLLTFKPFVYAINVSQEDLHMAPAIKDEFEAVLKKPVAVVCAKMEHEMLDFSSEERNEYLGELLTLENVEHIPTLDDLIALAFRTVGLMYYFTTWEKETRAWTIPVNSTAPQAAWAIHTDFERGFIKAEIVSYEDLLAAGTWVSAKSAGKVTLQWKDYIVKDWDIIIFKFNV